MKLHGGCNDAGEGQNTIHPFPHPLVQIVHSKPVRMKPGSIVRCVDDSNWSSDTLQHFPTLPVKDCLYTVRRIIPNTDVADGPPGVALEEIRGVWENFETYFGTIVFEEYHFRMNRFKEELPPLDQELFNEMIESETLVNL